MKTKTKKQKTNVHRAAQLAAAIIVIALLFLLTSPSAAAGYSNARAIGMAGSYTSLAKGFHSPAFNPANLGLPAMRQNGIEIIGVGVAISNNSFSLDDYNTYTGATLSEDDKDELLSKVPAEGLMVTADAEATALSVGMGNFAFSITGIGAAEINLGRAPLELILRGP